VLVGIGGLQTIVTGWGNDETIIGVNESADLRHVSTKLIGRLFREDAGLGFVQTWLCL
jgi:hypothetical protein